MIHWRGLLLGVASYCLVASGAAAAEGSASGGGGSVRLKGESDSYRLATPKAAVTLQAKGAGELILKIRAVLPAGAIPSEGPKVRILDNGNEIGRLSLSIFSSGAFSDRTDVVPGGPSARSFKLNEGNHNIIVESKGGNAAVSMHWKGKQKKLRGHAAPAAAPEPPDNGPDLALAPLSDPTPPPAAPAAPPPAVAAAPELVPAVGVAPAPLAPPPTQPAPLVLPKPAPIAEIASSSPPPAVPAATEAPVAITASKEESRSPLPFVFLGIAAACAVGSGVTIGLATNQYSTYNSTSETVGGVYTTRPNMLNTANNELAAAEILGAAAAAFLVATGVSLFF